jgi:hypothetical protein
MKRCSIWLFNAAFISLLTLGVAVVQISASAPPIDIRASQSANGSFMVVTGYEYEHPDATPRAIRRATFSVLRKEFVSKPKLDAGVPFWSAVWEVSLTGKEARQSYWPLVSNDGNTLALFGLTFPVPGVPVLKLYRRGSSGGELIRSYGIDELWPAKEVASRYGQGFHSADQLWFTRGRFAFTDDSTQFTYLSPWFELITIHLPDGTISRVQQ